MAFSNIASERSCFTPHHDTHDINLRHLSSSPVSEPDSIWDENRDHHYTMRGTASTTFDDEDFDSRRTSLASTATTAPSINHFSSMDGSQKKIATSLKKAHEKEAWWLVNMPAEEREVNGTESCPEYLRGLNPHGQKVLSMPNEEFVRLSWDVVREIVAKNQIDRFQRTPADLIKYLRYTFGLKKEYGSVLAFVQRERLKWEDLTPSGAAPFEDDDDIKILYNDWPYGIDEDIVHLVVWTKFRLADDPATDDLTTEARQSIESFVDSTFRSRCPPDSVVWFKNWSTLRSIEDIPHFHVMLFQPDHAVIEDVTHGDIPLCQKVA